MSNCFRSIKSCYSKTCTRAVSAIACSRLRQRKRLGLQTLMIEVDKAHSLTPEKPTRLIILICINFEFFLYRWCSRINHLRLFTFLLQVTFLEANLNVRFKPGSFSCSPPVWQTNFPLHPRVKQTQGGHHGGSIALHALKNVLVTNMNSLIVLW